MGILHEKLDLDPYIEYKKVTPAVAKKLLAGNHVNRRLRPVKVNQYALDMKAGKWTEGNDLICVGIDGSLLNGQHRLNAVIQSGVTVKFAIQYNTPGDAMENMDSGLKRTIADVLKWNGETNTNVLGSAVRVAIMVETGIIVSDIHNLPTSHAAIITFLENHPELRHSTTEAVAAVKYVDCTASVLAVVHWMIGLVNGEAVADTFLYELAHQTNQPEGSAILACHFRLRRVRLMHQHYDPREYIAILLRTFNYTAKRTPVRSLNIHSKGEFKLPVVVKMTHIKEEGELK